MTSREARGVLSNRFSAQTRIGAPMNESGPLVGVAAESRSEAYIGSRFSAGIMAGYGSGPATIGGWPVGFDAFFEAGTPLGSSLFHRGAHYLGATFDVPIRFSARRNIQDLNESTWILFSRFELVPMIHTRTYADYDPHFERRWDVELGFAIRMRLHNDLF